MLPYPDIATVGVDLPEVLDSWTKLLRVVNLNALVSREWSATLLICTMAGPLVSLAGLGALPALFYILAASNDYNDY